MNAFLKITELTAAVIIMFICPGLWAYEEMQLAGNAEQSAVIRELKVITDTYGGLDSDVYFAFKKQAEFEIRYTAFVPVPCSSKNDTEAVRNSGSTEKVSILRYVFSEERIEEILQINGCFYPETDGFFEIISERV